MNERKLMKWKLKEMELPERIGYEERDAVEYLKSSRKAEFKTGRWFLASRNKEARRQDS